MIDPAFIIGSQYVRPPCRVTMTREADMKWRRRNLGAKLTVLAASLVALFGGWAFIRQNPPATDATTTAPAESTQAPATTTGTSTLAPVEVTRKTHTRTHVS